MSSDQAETPGLSEDSSTEDVPHSETAAALAPPRFARARRCLARATRWFKRHLGLSVLFISLAAAGAVALVGFLTWDWLVSSEPQGESNGATIRNLGLLYAALVSGLLVAWRNHTAGLEAKAVQTQASLMVRQAEEAKRQVETAQRGAARQRFDSASALLSSDSLRDRLSAIEELHTVGSESREHHLEQVVQTLCTFARHPTGQPTENAAARVPDEDRLDADFVGAPAAREDVVAAVRAASSLLAAADETLRSPLRLELVGVVLCGADLNGVLFAGANLGHADLRRVDLSRADLSRANLRDALLSDANLSRVDAIDASFSDAALSGANFSRAGLSGVDLDGVSARNSDFGRADLSRVRALASDFADASFMRALLTDSDFSDSEFHRVNFTRADLTRLNLNRANLTQANLNRARLTETRLSEASLVRANLTRANATDADFSGARLDSARLLEAELTSAHFSVEVPGEIDVDEAVTLVEIDGSRFFVASGLTQAQLNRAVAEPGSPPILFGLVDEATDRPLEWNGGSLPDERDEDENRATP